MKKVVALIGPTASGKTYFSIEVAKRLNLEIINGDSVQIHKNLNIGSAKIKPDEMQGIKHHLLDVIEVTDDFSVADYQKMVRKKIEEFNYPFIVGGTGFYIKSVLYKYDFSSNGRKIDTEKKFENYTNFELYNYLKILNPNLASTYHENNRKRVLRAIEIATEDKISYEKDLKEYDSLVILLDVDRKLLYEKINLRVDEMVNEGLVEEVKKLYDDGILVDAIGYKELYPYFKNEISFTLAIENIKKNTRHFAKRQMTYFRNQFPNLVKVEYDYQNKINTLEKIEKLIKEFFNL